MRAMDPPYNNNEEIKYENKIKIIKTICIYIIILNDDYDNYDTCYDNSKFYYVIYASSLSS